MPTNLAIDDHLIEQAQKLGHHRTKKDTVNAALDEYIRRRKQTAMPAMISSVSAPRSARERSRRYLRLVSRASPYRPPVEPD